MAKVGLFAALAVGLATLLRPGLARAEGPNPFSCPGQALAILDGLDTSDMSQELEKRRDAHPEGESNQDRAMRLCVVAEIMVRLGDTHATHTFEQAIAADPDEGGYELWLGAYLGLNRGSRSPLIEDAERHLYRALAKVHRRRAAGQEASFDATTEEWAQRKLVELYQADGLPVLPWKGYPYGSNTDHNLQAPGVFVAAEGRTSYDTNDFVDLSDVRNFTSEMLFAESPERLNRQLTLAEKRAIAIAAPRYSLWARARVRQNVLGSIDFSYRSSKVIDGQIIRYDQPAVFGNATVNEYGVTYKRGFDLYPFFDATIEASYRRVDRQGIVEFFPLEWEHIGLTELKPSISRFIGPDVVTIGLNYVNMDISNIVGGELDQQKRARGILAAYFDYAFYRPLLLPSTSEGLRLRRQSTRGWHIFGGAAYDDEVFGTRIVERRDFYGGTSLLGIGRWDFTVQGTLFQGGAVDSLPYGTASLANAQWRTTVVPLYRIIDGDAYPDMPKTERPVSLNLVFPLRQDVSTQGPNTYDNFRLGAELWTRFVSPHLRGSSFLLSGGYAFQYFYQIQKPLNVARIDLGLGW